MNIPEKIAGILHLDDKRSFASLIKELIVKSNEDEVNTEAAALSYYIVFSIFPLLILFNNVVGLMNLNAQDIAESLKAIVPNEVMSIIIDYLSYAQETVSPVLMTFSLVFSIYFPYRAIRALMNNIRKAYDLPKRKSYFSSLIRELACTLLIPVAVFTCLLLVIFGQNVVTEINKLLFNNAIRLSRLMLDLWQVLRFVLAGGVFALVLTVLYELSLDHSVSMKKLLPGISLAIVFWVAASAVFSFYVENFANYSVIYGTLGGFIVLLLWLYFTSTIFMVGAELNAALFRRSSDQ